MKKPPSLNDRCKEFLRACHPKGGISEVQEREMRMAFFAGAHSLMTIIRDVGSSGCSEDDGCKILRAFEVEILIEAANYVTRAKARN